MHEPTQEDLARALDSVLALLGRREWGGYSCPSHALLLESEVREVVDAAYAVLRKWRGE